MCIDIALLTVVNIRANFLIIKKGIFFEVFISCYSNDNRVKNNINQFLFQT